MWRQYKERRCAQRTGYGLGTARMGYVDQRAEKLESGPPGAQSRQVGAARRSSYVEGIIRP
jgi:hypothetical protein